MAFTIRFEGLISHIGTEADPDNKLHAALVSDKPTHNPTLKVDAAAPRVLNLGDTVKFSTGAGKARVSPLFKLRVPGLKQLLPMGTTIEPTVLSATHNAGANGALAFVIFPNGSLDAPELSFRPLDFDGTDGVFIKKMCVSRGAFFTSDANATEVTVENGGTVVHRVALAAGSKVVISNTSSTTTGHFHLYSEITTAAAIAKATADHGRKCTPIEITAARGSMFDVKEQDIATEENLRKADADKADSRADAAPSRPTAPHAECTNSNWP